VEPPRLIATIVRLAADLVVVDPDIDGEVDSASGHRSSIGYQTAPHIVVTPKRHPQRLERNRRGDASALVGGARQLGTP
jgi:hypothetical protein